MTVEQTPLGHFQIPAQRDYDKALKWLKEITRVEDLQILNDALAASKKQYGMYDMEQAIQLVFQENDRKQDLLREPEQSQMLVPLPDRDCGVQRAELPTVGHQQTDSTDAVIDLTNESEKDDLQKAIALSLQEQHGVFGGQVTTEEQDISRVLEASLLDSKVVGTKRKRGEVWQDPLNPYDRQRNGDWPVGLKNVGNTCWFAAVIQSLFHLPAFRHLVLNFSLLKEWDGNTENGPGAHSLLFMRELRKLFALMVATERKYVDPSQALDVVREAFTNSASTDNQQDVSEFSHKLIEWLEDAYKLSSTDHASETRNANPMTKLFYGRLKSEGLNSEYSSCHESKFGQYPLQMNGFSEIHESLESAVVAPEIESCSASSASKFGQETWFTQLPPVLVFELSRFHFNQLLGVPEKIHNKFEFPEVIYMDRYLEKNKLVTRDKREMVRKLKEDRGKLIRRLEKYMNYGSGSKRVPLQDVLQYALEFVETKPEAGLDLFRPVGSQQEDIEMASPQVNRCPEEPKIPSSSEGSTSQSPDEATPCPRHITEGELSVFQSCLNRWRMEVEADVKDLQDEINRADNTITEIYNEPPLQKVPYRLHAVLVHEGQAVSGHYWAYVYSPQRETWLKFNDITVTEATWTDLLKESMGGYHHASAYCLMYVDRNSEKLFLGERISKMENLAKDLQTYVSSDNVAFAKEKETWDMEQSCKKDCSTMTSDPAELNKYAECTAQVPSIGSPLQFNLHAPQVEHAALALKSTADKLKSTVKGPSYNFNKLLSELTDREFFEQKQKAKSGPDTRVESVGVFFLLNHLPLDPFLKIAVLEQFSHPALVEFFPENEDLCKFRRETHDVLTKQWGKLSKETREKYLEWHQLYSNFRKVINSFVTGVEKYQQEKYEGALQYFVDAFAMNAKLVSSGDGKYCGFDAQILGHFRRKCVLQLNEKAVRQFQDGDADSVLENVTMLVDEFIVPSMTFLCSASASKVDADAAVQVRDSWCTMIGFPCSDEKRQFLGKTIEKLIDPQKEGRISKPSVALRITDLHLKFYATMQLIKSSGELQLTEAN